MNLRDQRGKPVTLDNLLGKGGEGDVFAVRGRSNLVAKIYHSHSAEKVDKLKAMVDHPPTDPTQRKGHVSICWPESMLFNSSNLCVGFLMPLLDRSKHRELLNFYNPQDRHVHAPNFTWAYLLKTAENVAIVVDSIHSRSYVIGDINESNFFVSDQALITLVDCDSMQVRTPSATFRCTVAKPEYLAPELHGRDLSVTDRTPEHDNFAMAVLLFLLLMEGVHPYSGSWKGLGDAPSLEDRIASGDCPYAGSKQISPMRLAPSFDILPASLRSLFVRAFGQGNIHPSSRPSAREWRQALSDVQLTQCSTNKQHSFPKHLTSCPWCERTSLLGGFDPFPSPASHATQQPLKRRPFASPVRPAKPAPARPAPVLPRTAVPSIPSPTRYSFMTISRRVGTLIQLVPFLSALLSLVVFAALPYRSRFFFYGSYWLLAGVLGFILNASRRRYARCLVNLGALSLLLYGPYIIGTGSWISLFVVFAAFFSSRSLLLLFRRRLENAAAYGQLAKTALAAAVVSIALPPLSALAVMAANASGFHLKSFSVLSGIASTSSTNTSAQVLTCARIKGSCGCQMKNSFHPGDTVSFLITSSSSPNLQLMLALPNALPQPVSLPQRWQASVHQNCMVAHFRIPADTRPGYASLRLSGDNSSAPSLATGFLVTK